MSAAMMSAALRTPGLTPGERVLYAYLWDRADADGICWPGVEEITEHTGLSKRKITDALAALVDDKRDLLEVERRHKKSSIYRVKPPPAGARKVNGFCGADTAAQNLRRSFSGAETDILDQQNLPIESPIESPIERTLLRKAAPAAPSGEPEQKVLEIFGQEVIDRVASVTGRSKAGCRELIGQWRNLTRHDDGRILEAIGVAERMGTKAGVGVIRNQLVRKSEFEAARERVLASYDSPVGTA